MAALRCELEEEVQEGGNGKGRGRGRGKGEEYLEARNARSDPGRVRRRLGSRERKTERAPNSSAVRGPSKRRVFETKIEADRVLAHPPSTPSRHDRSAAIETLRRRQRLPQQLAREDGEGMRGRRAHVCEEVWACDAAAGGLRWWRGEREHRDRRKSKHPRGGLS